MGLAVGATRSALAARCATVSGLRAYDKIPAAPVPPCAIVGAPDTIEFDSTFGDSSTAFYGVTLLAARGDDATAQALIDSWLNVGTALSVRDAINGNLGGVVMHATVVRAESYGQQLFGFGDEAVSYLGVTLVVEVVS